MEATDVSPVRRRATAELADALAAAGGGPSDGAAVNQHESAHFTRVAKEKRLTETLREIEALKSELGPGAAGDR